METKIDYNPAITIGMPTKDDAFCIARVLKCMENLDYPKSKIKLIFVDGFSTDGTYDILVEWKEKFKGCARVFCESRLKSTCNLTHVQKIDGRNKI